MGASRAYEEVIDFIAAGSSPSKVVAFRPSEAAKRRAAELVSLEKDGALTPEETSELEHYLQLEHIMRLAKARARKYLSSGD
jgi:hypothetical protein